MKITELKPYPVWVGNRNQLVVKVETDEGIFGLGESGLSGRELAVIGALKHFREFLVGQDPMQRGRIWQELYRSQYFEGGQGGVNEAELLFPTQPRLDGVAFPVPDAPGLGIEFDEERAAAQSWKFWEAPHWRRRDGSVTN